MNPVKPQISRAVVLVMLLLGGITSYWMLTYSGPYRYVAELQMNWFGSYSRADTVGIVALGWVVVTGAIKLVLTGPDRDMSRRFHTLTRTPAVAWAEIKAAIPESAPRFIRFTAVFSLVGIGGWAYYNGTHAGSLQQLNAVDFQSGKVQARVVYAEVRGHLSKDYVSSDYYLYIPMTGYDRAATPVQLVVGVNENEQQKYVRREADGTFTVRGIADKGLQADVKYAFARNGLTVADPVWVVHAGRDPSWDKEAGLMVMAAGIVLAGVVMGLESYKKRKRTAF